MQNLIVKTMLNELMAKQGCSVSSVVEKTGVSKKTLYRVLANSIKPSIKTEMNLISFYCFCVAKASHAI